jgi:hypothetical protein
MVPMIKTITTLNTVYHKYEIRKSKNASVLEWNEMKYRVKFQIII